MDMIDKLTEDLLHYLHCNPRTRGSVEEIYADWAQQSSEIPPFDMIPTCFKMIENFLKSSVSPDLLNACYAQTFGTDPE